MFAHMSITKDRVNEERVGEKKQRKFFQNLFFLLKKLEGE
jgi:hypothetical protein